MQKSNDTKRLLNENCWRKDTKNLKKFEHPNRLKFRKRSEHKNYVNYKQKKLSDQTRLCLNRNLKTNNNTLKDVVIPTSYDLRDSTGASGQPILVDPQDQGNCGSCYAFAMAHAFADRISIATNGSTKNYLSTQDMVNCGPAFADTLNNRGTTIQEGIDNGTLLDSTAFILLGCDGGLLAGAVNYTILQGLPLETNVPYLATDANCNSQNLLKFKASSGEDLIPGIEDGFPSSEVEFSEEELAENVQNIQLAILEQGPVVTGFNVYTDFLIPSLWEDFVYIKRNFVVYNGQTIPVTYQGGHAVEIVGWGSMVDPEDPDSEAVDYWICKNSWGTEFANNGYFRIQRGVNMVNIETDVVTMNIDTNILPSESEISSAAANGSTAADVSGPPLGVTFWVIISIVIFVVLLIIIISVVYAIKKKTPKSYYIP